MGRKFKNKQTGAIIELIPICPLCRAQIHWSMHGGQIGDSSPANCANNLTATRIIINPENIITCNWAGIVVRNKFRDVDIFNKDGTPVPHRAVKLKYV